MDLLRSAAGRGLASLLVLGLSACQHGRAGGLVYPESPLDGPVETKFGTSVADPYRWLEAGESPRTKAWIEAQNRVTFAHLESIPRRAELARRLEEIFAYERYGVPVVKGGRMVVSHNTGLENQDQLWVFDASGGAPRVLLDPNTFAKDGTVAIRNPELSPSGRLLAYGLSKSGSDWTEFRVRDVETGVDLEDRIEWSKFSRVSWLPDESGFLYSAYDPPKGAALEAENYYHKLYLHRLGTRQADDRLVHENPAEKTWGFDGVVTEDGAHLVIHVWRGSDRQNALYVKRMDALDRPALGLFVGFDAGYELVTSRGSTLYIWTNRDAPRGRLVAIDAAGGEARTVLPESDATLTAVTRAGGTLFAHFIRDARSEIVAYDLDGRPRGTIALPGIGAVSGLEGEVGATFTHFAFASFTAPTTIFRLPLDSLVPVPEWTPKLAADVSGYETEQRFVTSKDGTRVPMFVVAKKGLVKDGSHPTLLYGYGGFDISLLPSFRSDILLWLEQGGVYAVPNLRGGGEYGKPWHEAGMKERKQNVFDDFIAAAEHLIAAGYTRPERLAIHGRSNGGLLVGAAMTQRPELFAVALPAVGVMDMLRFHKFTIGWAWTAEYGSPDDPKDFPVLLAYSPLHRLTDGVRYPATLVLTADTDDRVVPAHSFKFAARLQAAHAGPTPALIRIETKAGHGAGKPLKKRVEEAADMFAFALAAFGLGGPSR